MMTCLQWEPAVGQLLVRDCPPQINNRASDLDMGGGRIEVSSMQRSLRLRVTALVACCRVRQKKHLTLTLKGAENEQDGIVSIASA
jgi:hypothetical protein